MATIEGSDYLTRYLELQDNLSSMDEPKPTETQLATAKLSAEESMDLSEDVTSLSYRLNLAVATDPDALYASVQTTLRRQQIQDILTSEGFEVPVS